MSHAIDETPDEDHSPFVDIFENVTADGDTREQDEKRYAVLAEHAERCWEAEQKNAERLVERLKVMATLAAVLLSVGLYKFDWLHNPGDVSRVPLGAPLNWIRGLLSLALLLLGVSFAVTLWRWKWKPHASRSMFFTGEEVLDPPETAAAANELIFMKTHVASAGLMDRNESMDKRLRWATWSSLSGMALAIIALLVFMLFSVPPTMTDERRAYDAHLLRRESPDPGRVAP